MRPLIATDANPIISALIGGFSREVLFDHNFDFITTQFTIDEVEKYVPYIAKKAGVSESFVKSLLYLLPLKIYPQHEYQHCLSRARNLIAKDEKDADILALALAKNCPLWSNDTDFEDIQEIKLIKTKDFV